MFYGLPDANDHSKHKDFFAFYLWNYCSGTKSSGRYIVDYCSGPRHSLYDLFGPWNLWGTNVHKAGTHFYWLERGPKLLYIPYLVTICITILQMVTSIPTMTNDKVGQTTVILAFVSFTSAQAFPILTCITVRLAFIPYYGSRSASHVQPTHPTRRRRRHCYFCAESWRSCICR